MPKMAQWLRKLAMPLLEDLEEGYVSFVHKVIWSSYNSCHVSVSCDNVLLLRISQGTMVSPSAAHR